MKRSSRLILSATLTLTAPGFALVSSGVSAVGMLDTVPPSVPSLSVAATSTATPIEVTYSGASDVHSGPVSVALWFRGTAGDWIEAGLEENAGAGSFLFTPIAPASSGVYHFDAVVSDQLGNTTVVPAGSTGDGLASTLYAPPSNVGDWWMLQ